MIDPYAAVDKSIGAKRHARELDLAKK